MCVGVCCCLLLFKIGPVVSLFGKSTSRRYVMIRCSQSKDMSDNILDLFSDVQTVQTQTKVYTLFPSMQWLSTPWMSTGPWMIWLLNTTTFEFSLDTWIAKHPVYLEYCVGALRKNISSCWNIACLAWKLHEIKLHTILLNVTGSIDWLDIGTVCSIPRRQHYKKKRTQGEPRPPSGSILTRDTILAMVLTV